MTGPLTVKNVHIRRVPCLVVFGDTTGFSTFTRRSLETPKVVSRYCLNIYNEFFRFQRSTNGSMKLRGDGFLCVHPIVARKRKALTNYVLMQSIKLQQDLDHIINKMNYPKPNGFRIRLSAGFVWRMTVKFDGKSNCQILNCAHNHFEDWIGYPLILAERMLKMDRDTALVCCQAVREAAGDSNFDFKKLPIERRRPRGVFVEDVQDLYTFELKHDQGEKNEKERA